LLCNDKLVIIEDAEGFLIKKVTPFGAGAKVNCGAYFAQKPEP